MLNEKHDRGGVEYFALMILKLVTISPSITLIVGEKKSKKGRSQKEGSQRQFLGTLSAWSSAVYNERNSVFIVMQYIQCLGQRKRSIGLR